MNTYVRKAWGLSWLLMLASQCFADTPRVEQAEPRLDVTVYVFNYAEVPGGTLARAQAVAARIFREVGVKLAWSHGPVSAADTARGVHLKPTDVVLRILPRSMAEALGLPPNTFGFAFPEKKGGFGTLTNIFYHRVKELSDGHGYGRGLMLGHLMAHEMGHLFLGIGSHSDRGIMHIPWRTKQLDRAASQNLLFTSAQAKRVRAQVLARLRAEQDDRRSQPE